MSSQMAKRLFASVSRTTAIFLYKCTLVGILAVCSLPVLRTASFFRLFVGDHLLRSWDGSAHLAATYLYDRSIFPDTFGWTHAWSAGMPLPNFYPPLFYWTVAALHHTGIPLHLAFKLIVAIPFLLIPSALGLLSCRLSSRDILITSCTTLMACFPLLDSRFQSQFPGGLTYTSTFNEGLYTQPLGFILFVLWIAMYFDTITSWRRLALASLMLASVALASFFSAIAALPFAIVGLLHDFYKTDHRFVLNLPGARVGLPSKAVSLLCSALLGAFWAVPVIAEYPYFVTRPLQVSWSAIVPPGPWIWIWLGAALGGGMLMSIKNRGSARTFMIGSVGLVLLTLPPLSSLHWIPSQPPRLLSTLTFLMAVPVGWLLASLIRSLVQFWRRGQQATNIWSIAVVGSIALAMAGYLKPSSVDQAVYTGNASISSVLDFARTHRDGRYIVENAWQHGDQRDSRALNAYLGMQGNETLNIVFHEASPSSVFFTPLVSALSASEDSFGISSALANDLNFYNQSPEQHLRRARGVGVRYIACQTPWIKRRFRQQPDLIEYNLGRWSVFEITAQASSEVEILQYLPALVVSALNFKERLSGSFSFVRLAEEQFNSGLSRVLLVHAETKEIDKLSNLDRFGALILETYDYADQDAAFEVVRRFAQQRLVVLISSDRSFYLRLARRISELPHALIVRREPETHSEWLNRSMPWLELDQSRIRNEWRLIQEAMENGKVSSTSDTGQASLSGDDAGISVTIPDTKGAKVPVLVRMTFHPDWIRPDGQLIYPASPFFMLTYASGPFTARFRRTAIERAAAAVSAGVFFALVVAIIAGNRTPRWRRVIRAHLTTSMLKKVDANPP
jgi:hypothetical protein